MKKEKKYSEKLEKNNDVKKLTQKDEEGNTTQVDSSLNQTTNIETLTNFEHSNLKQLDKN